MRPPISNGNSNSSSEKVTLEPDYYEAIIIETVYMGNIPTRFSKGTQPTLYLGFEIVGVENEKGYPLVLRQDYNYVLSDRSHLYKLCEKWLVKNRGTKEEEPWSLDRAKNFDPSKLVEAGVRVRLNVTENKGWNNIKGAAPSKLDGKGVAKSKKLIFDVDNPTAEAYNALPVWMQQKIMCAEEWNAAVDKMGVGEYVETQPYHSNYVEPKTKVATTPEIQKEFGNNTPTQEQKEIIANSSADDDDDDLPF